MHRRASLDHQPFHAAFREVVGQRAHLDRVAGVDDGRDRSESRAGVVDTRPRAVDELLRLPGGEELSARRAPPGGSR